MATRCLQRQDSSTLDIATCTVGRCAAWQLTHGFAAPSVRAWASQAELRTDEVGGHAELHAN